ncbi:hypothetical protein BH11BAC2_BH11BAC2_04130 [soil metagenome]
MTKDIPSPDQFNALNFDEQAWHVWHHATFMIVRQNSQYRVNLYYMNGYYIQLWYHVKRNRIAKIGATRSNKVLDCYLKLIEVENLNII